MEINPNGKHFTIGEISPLGRIPPNPTDAEPGSEEKKKILRWRAERGYALHHPLDKKLSNTVIGFARLYMTQNGEEMKLYGA